jgi:hypothetical protein
MLKRKILGYADTVTVGLMVSLKMVWKSSSCVSLVFSTSATAMKGAGFSWEKKEIFDIK